MFKLSTWISHYHGYYITNLYQNFSIKMNAMLNKNNRDMIH